MFRRLVSKPRRLTLPSEGLFILLMIAGLMVTALAAAACRIILAPAPSDHWQFAGRALAGVLAGLPRGAGEALFPLSWWFHAVLLLGFLVYLPYSKHLHVMAAPLNVFFGPQTPKGWFSSPDLENAESFGVGAIAEFAWKDPFALYSCTECGRCTSGCPANVSGKELDPKWLILNLREHLQEGGRGLLAKAGDGGHEAPHDVPMVGGVIKDNVLWACTTCRWCVDACPVFIEHVPKIVDMRRWLVLTESRFPAELQPTFRNLENNGNPWQMAWQTRADWAKDLGVKVMSDVSQAEYLYWVGGYGSFDERNKKVARGLGKLLPAVRARVSLPDPRPGECPDTQAVPVPEDHHGLSPLLQHDPARVPELRGSLQRDPPYGAAGRADSLRSPPRLARVGRSDHLSRPVLPRPLQRHLRAT